MLKKLKKLFYTLIILALLAGIGYFLYENPTYVTRFQTPQQPQRVETKIEAVEFLDVVKKSDIENIYHQIAVLQDSIVFINNRIADVKDDISNLDLTQAPAPAAVQPVIPAEIIEETKRLIDSKADANIILGVITRLDKIEERLEKVAKISDKGALVLTAAMLVRDRADRGDSFLYEAEVLGQLSESEPRIQDAVQTIVSMASEGIATDGALAFEFLSIYNTTAKKQEQNELSWQDRIKNKFNEVVHVKKTNAADSVEEKEQKSVDIAGNYVSRGEFTAAVRVLEKAGRPEFDAWIGKAEKRIAFDQAISRISAHSLALMKLNQIGGLKSSNE